MKTRQLPINKGKVSMKFASLDVEDSFNPNPTGAWVNFNPGISFTPVSLQSLQVKMKAWFKNLHLFYFFSTGLIRWRFLRRNTSRSSLVVKKRLMTLVKNNKAFSQLSFNPAKLTLDFYPDFNQVNPDKLSLATFLFKKRQAGISLDDISIEALFGPESYSTIDRKVINQPQPVFIGQETEDLAKTGSWQFHPEPGTFTFTPYTSTLLNTGSGIPNLVSSLAPADQEAFQEKWQSLLTGLEELAFEARLENGSWIRILGRAVREKNNGFKISGIVQDVSEYKNLEAQLMEIREAKEKCEQETKAKSDFLSMISHEIRTPLNLISGYTYLLLQEEVPRDEQKECLQSIQFSTQNLLSLINDTLDFSKLEAGKVEFEVESFHFQNILNEIHRSFFFRAAEKKVNVYLDLLPGIPEVVVGDPYKLYQILNNLISNAIKFTQDGHIKISVDVVYESENAWILEISVSDTGVGIPLEKQHLIFDSFIQANASTNRQYGGTGLGLAITKRLVELQNGTITLNSTPGEGAEFLVQLKFGKPDPTQAVIQELSLHPNQYVGLQGTKILVVDDNPLNLNVASKLLTNWQVQVDTAKNGFDALKMVRRYDYDLILMDLFMPVMDGFEAIAQIKDFGIQTPIIALTGNTYKEEGNKVIAMGALDYITKPFNPRDLYHTILSQLN